MTATLAYRTWEGSQGRGRFLSDSHWKPNEMVVRLDRELPDAGGILILHAGGRSNVDALVFQLPEKPDLYFMVILHEPFGDKPPKVTQVHVYVRPPHVEKNWVQDEITGDEIDTFRIVENLAELRVYVPPTVRFEKAREEERQKDLDHEKRVQAMYEQSRKGGKWCVLV